MFDTRATSRRIPYSTHPSPYTWSVQDVVQLVQQLRAKRTTANLVGCTLERSDGTKISWNQSGPA
jgi:hypothetical protein